MTFQKVIRHRLKKNQFRVLQELQLDNIQKSAEYSNINPTTNKDRGYNKDKGEYKDQDNNKDKDKFPDDNKI